MIIVIWYNGIAQNCIVPQRNANTIFSDGVFSLLGTNHKKLSLIGWLTGFSGGLYHEETTEIIHSTQAPKEIPPHRVGALSIYGVLMPNDDGVHIHADICRADNMGKGNGDYEGCV